MCLAVPMRIVECDPPMGVVELEGTRRRVFLGFVEDAQAGDYVLIHAGCAVERLRPEEAEADLAMIRLLLESAGTGADAAGPADSAGGPESPERGAGSDESGRA